MDIVDLHRTLKAIGVAATLRAAGVSLSRYSRWRRGMVEAPPALLAHLQDAGRLSAEDVAALNRHGLSLPGRG